MHVVKKQKQGGAEHNAPVLFFVKSVGIIEEKGWTVW
jgi:hypothetical protein